MCETRSFTFWLFQVVVLFGLLIFFLWLSLHPRQPTYTIVQFSIPNPNNTNTNSTANEDSQSGTVLFELEIENPNQDSNIYHDDTFLTFYYSEEALGQKTISSFHQKKGTTSQIFDHVNTDAQVWKKLLNAVWNATAELKVTVVSKIRYRMWGLTSKHHGINLQGNLPIGSDGKISGKKKKIKLGHNSKKSTKKGTR
ncbi:protein NDR1-like [Camellia sinensis]|uniref:Late embryogenesis abundant protein LEA-2 subgroup domain-containing protein n=1 Tax=Camellia sinensis var. sinensis TaxID=542762 RepID=A0A4S4DTR0_CAMSN|nr:protein NDR1-like [Camellia sinensis]XP_028127516.1 protein NDR1-like [Camellia sinensis]THG06652.1 hypothetical protein TEA_005275 [Camellia sinensis var. sinensis]THG22999.1 hypothetical protein TEA_017984 [Camellia sinensis var. sinensis]